MSCTGLYDIDDGGTTTETASSAMVKFGEKRIRAWLERNGVASNQCAGMSLC